jgi:acetyl-CoA carboxylase biotin carboxyl carrier protein
MASKTFEAPVPGTFFRKSAPDQPPFKGEGDDVAVGDTLGLIEVMKTFTPVVAGDGGAAAL